MSASPGNATCLIRLECVGKTYAQLSGANRLQSLARILAKRPLAGTTVLSGIDLEVHRGQSLGIVGENGAGKSTLLKLIAQVMQPSCGRVQVNGKVGALLELGAGFHPEYSGRDNVLLACSLMGLDRAAALERFEDIIAFADIGSYIDEPLKHYSSGMTMRLGFAVATALKPDVLITDEVLAVGDEAFQRKCFRWLDGYLAQGGTLLLCSHILYHVQKLCHRAVWLHAGQIRLAGSAEDVAREYLAYQEAKDARNQSRETAAAEVEVPLHARLEVKDFQLQDASGQPLSTLAFGGELRAAGEVVSPDGRRPHVAIGVVRADGTAVFGTSSQADSIALTPISSHRYRFAIRFPQLQLLPGRYHLRAHAMDPEGLGVWDQHELAFTVTGSVAAIGLTMLEHGWD